MVNCDYLKSVFKGLLLFILYLFVSEVLCEIVSFVGGLIAPVDHKLTRSPLIHLLRFRFSETTDDDWDFVPVFLFHLNFAVICIASDVVLDVVRRFSKTFILILAFCIVPCPFIIWLLVDSCVSVFNIVMVSVMFFLYVFTSLILVWIIMERTNANKTDEQQYFNIYREQLKNKDTLKVNIIQCMTVGPPTVGKTTLKKQLLEVNTATTVVEEHDRPPSSPVCEKAKRIQVILEDKKNEQSPSTVTVNRYTWKTISLDEEVIGYLKKMAKNNSKYITITEVLFWTLFFATMGRSLSCLFAYLQICDEKFNNDSIPIIFDYTNWSHCLVFFLCLFFPFLMCSMGSNRLIPSSTADFAVKEALQRNDIRKLQPLFDRTLTIYFRDCGGQPEFHEVLPALVSQSTLFFLVFNLSESLDSQYKVTYKTNISEEVSDPYVSSFTVKQALLQCLASISSIGNYLKIKTNRLKSMFMSKVIIIGTHKDLLRDTGEAVERVCHISNQLEDELKGTDWYFEDMIVRTESGRVVLGINSFSPCDIKKVKDLFNKVALNGDHQLEIPVSWLVFDFCIRKFGKKVMPLEECLHLANECEMLIGDEFNAALWFLHNKVGTIRYFENVPEVQNVVITDPQLLFDIVTDLIVNTFSFGKHIQRKSEHDRFCSSGRFTKHHLEQCEAVKEKLLSIEQVIAVLEHLVIIAPVGINESNEEEYFLPCVLVHASLPSTPLLRNNSEIPCLLITFKCCYTPRGIFSSLIAKILLDGKDKWKLSSEEIKRNQVKFCLVKSGHIVTITNFFKFLEISVKPPRGLRKKENVHVFIQQYISQCLAYVRDQLNYTVTADHLFGLYCNEIHDSPVDPHPAECYLEVESPYKKCCLEGSLTASLSPKEKIWFHEECDECTSSEQINQSYPQEPACLDITHLDIVYNYLMEQKFPKSSWQLLGLQLGLYQPTLNDIDAKNRGDPTKCLQDCLAAWLKGGDKVTEKGESTWSTLASAFNKSK